MVQSLVEYSPSFLDGGPFSGFSSLSPDAFSSPFHLPFQKQAELFNKCLTKVIYPAGNTKLQDGVSTSGVENYKEFWYGLVGLSGIGQNFDGNGSFARLINNTRPPSRIA